MPLVDGFFELSSANPMPRFDCRRGFGVMNVYHRFYSLGINKHHRNIYEAINIMGWVRGHDFSWLTSASGPPRIGLPNSDMPEMLYIIHPLTLGKSPGSVTTCTMWTGFCGLCDPLPWYRLRVAKDILDVQGCFLSLNRHT